MKPVFMLLALLYCYKAVFPTHIEVNSIPSSQDTAFGVYWDADTILVTGQLTIYSNQHCNITIKPGTVIFFTGSYGIKLYSLTSSFNANGVPGDSIKFTAPESVRWSGIYLRFSEQYGKTKRRFNFSYCKFERCTTNVINFSGLDTLSTVSLIHNSFTGNISSSSIVCFSAEGGKIPVFKTLISGNLFSGNSCKTGAITIKNTNYENNKDVNMVIENNLFMNNSAMNGGAVFVEAEKVLIRNNRFEGNNAKVSGGALCVNFSPSIIERNVFIRNNIDISTDARPGTNGGGAVYVMFGFQDEYFDEPCVITNNYFAFNHAPNGGAIHCNDARTVIVNNTICNNYSNFGGGIYLESIRSYVRLYNTILWGNYLESGKNDQCYLWKSYPDFYNCIVEGSTDEFVINDSLLGEGNYPGKYMNSSSQYPEFVDTANCNFRLKNNSPCINNGFPDTNGLYITSVDLDSNLRIINGVIDIGCYEVLPVTSVERLHKQSVTPFKAKNISKLVFHQRTNSDRTFTECFNLQGRHVFTKYISGAPSGIYLQKKSGGKVSGAIKNNATK